MLENENQKGAQVNVADTTKNNKKSKSVRVFPSLSFEESLIIANSIWDFASGQKIRRITLFDQIGKSPDSGPSRALITSSAKYGLTKGGYQADYLELTPKGAIATNPEEIPEKQAETKFDLAIKSNTYFFQLYDNFKDMKVPTSSVLIDFLMEKGLDEQESKKGVELFIVNAQYIGLIKLLAGSERIVTIDQVIEELSTTSPSDNQLKPNTTSISDPLSNITEISTAPDGKWENVCFYITPIGADGSEERKHSDLFLSSIVEPALQEFGFTVFRADKISAPGMITSQIIEYIMNAKLVIADLSFHNPNVFYELSLRHTFNLPTIHLIRKCDSIPFDLNNFRTISIDTSSIYTLVPQLETYKTLIIRQVRQLLDNPDAIDNPISAYLSKNKITINTKTL